MDIGQTNIKEGIFIIFLKLVNPPTQASYHVKDDVQSNVQRDLVSVSVQENLALYVEQTIVKIGFGYAVILTKSQVISIDSKKPEDRPV